MAEDVKYGHVTTERGDIGETEPVVVFRAKDKLLPTVLADYLDMCQRAGSPPHHLDGIEEAGRVVEAWQAEHFTQVPQSAGVDCNEGTDV
jgi:hypothetical protein